MSRAPASEVVEKGDVFFFYRPRNGMAEMKELTQVQRLYMVLAADARQLKRTFLMLAIGGKRLPDVSEQAAPTERHWATVMRMTSSPNVLREELSAKRYVTVIRGERVLAAARTVGEGRYWL